ncbi:MAG: hypothetical protein ABS57_21745 [Mesorhizobium sp. SCN 65-12]|nr:MAG: hypothetical protein ABS57_21745 [Mesorhizobium sp. SCN 65-12]
MTDATGGTMPARRSRRWIALALVAATIAVFIGANAHLIYVAFVSQPDCVPHLKEAGREDGAFRAADAAC